MAQMLKYGLSKQQNILLCISDLITDPDQLQNCMYAGERDSKDFVEEGGHGEVIAAVSITLLFQSQ